MALIFVGILECTEDISVTSDFITFESHQICICKLTKRYLLVLETTIKTKVAVKLNQKKNSLLFIIKYMNTNKN